jgi:hypothetical protein
MTTHHPYKYKVTFVETTIKGEKDRIKYYDIENEALTFIYSLWGSKDIFSNIELHQADIIWNKVKLPIKQITKEGYWIAEFENKSREVVYIAFTGHVDRCGDGQGYPSVEAAGIKLIRKVKIKEGANK